MDACVFLNGNPYLFEKAMNKMAPGWRPKSANIRQIPTRNISNPLAGLDIDWNTVFDEVVQGEVPEN